MGRFDRLEDAISFARRITEDAIREAGSFEKWDGMSDAGLVYDSAGMPMWDGAAEFRQKDRKER